MKLNFLIFLTVLSDTKFANSDTSVDHFTNVASRIGNKLWELGENLTKLNEIQAAFSSINVVELNGKEIVKEITDRTFIMLESKKFALQQMVDTVEEFSKNLSDTIENPDDPKYQFKDAKNLPSDYKDKLSNDVNFFNESVSTNFSTVQVPTDVYSGGNETLLGIQCSNELDRVFKSNYKKDPSLSWQYFAGISGYMRIYPGIEWTDENHETLFDARNRPWYVEAATDPKDIVILVDNSGSMMGQKRKIARHTINTILETLGPNDFVSIFNFSQDVHSVVKCFNTSLVQANLLTIRELKTGVENMHKAGFLANFTNALTKAFQVLENHRRDHLASMCNQAIMLITDGVPDSYADIYRRFNWKNSTEPPFPVRVFTYLIGRDGVDFRDTRWMACANHGYYVQLTTMQDVKEQVFHYINVLARPLVLKNSKKIAWTSLYAHKTDPKVIDCYWKAEQNEQQKENTVQYRDDWRYFLNVSTQYDRVAERRKVELDQNKNIYEQDIFKFMITVSHPAYDQRPKKNITENILVNEAYWSQRVYEANIASLLGVAATDIPIEEFVKMMKPHYLGVNNYAFLVNNNGYVIVHPDLRPIFRQTLKPGFNSVDMLELELLDNADPNKSPRDFDIQVQIVNGEPMYTLNNLSLLRDLIINQTDNSNYSFMVKYHYDDMRRVSTGKRNYYIRRINNSPFTMVLAIMKPNCKDSLNCQASRVTAANVEDRISLNEAQIKELFSGNWNIHPKWFYCKFNYNNDIYKPWADKMITNKTSELLYFLQQMETSAFRDNMRDPYLALIQENIGGSTKKPSQKNKNGSSKTESKNNYSLKSYFCDKELVKNVIYDANITKRVFHHLEDDFIAPPELNFKKTSILNAFVATHSGLTRWKDFNNQTYFGDENSRAIDELWYKRAVQQYYINKDSFVYSVPLYHTSVENLVVTASHAIFQRKEKNGKRSSILEAPVAVVGYQFLYRDFEQYVKNVLDNTRRNLRSGSITFYVLDDNGYILATNNSFLVGKFFGEFQPNLMRSFKDCGIFKQIIVYDYQGVCFENLYSSAANIYSSFANPLKRLHTIVTWTVGTFLWGIVQIHVELVVAGLTASAEIFVSDYETDSDQEPVTNFDDKIISNEPPKYVDVKRLVMINRTRPQTCDRKVTLYTVESEKNWNRQAECANVTELIRTIPFTNLLLVIVSNTSENTNWKKRLSTDPVKITGKPICQKVNAVLSRRRPSSCSKYDQKEKDIKLCGNGNVVVISVTCLFGSIFSSIMARIVSLL